MAAGAEGCDASTYESSSTSGSDSYAASPVIFPEYMGARSAHSSPASLFATAKRDFRPSQAWREDKLSTGRFPREITARDAMGAGASRPAPRALVDAVEALGGATSAEVLELLDAFARAGPEDHVPVTADDVAALSSRSSRRLRTAAEVADAFDLPRRVAAVLMRRVPSVDDATGAAATAATRSRPRGFSLADAVVHLARCRDSRAAALEEADALLRAGALVDLAKMATTATTADDDDDDDEVDDEVDARAPPLAALRTMLARASPARRREGSRASRRRRGRSSSGPRASLAPRLRDAAGAPLTTTRTSGRRRGRTRVATSSPARARGCSPLRYRAAPRRGSDVKATWRRVYASVEDGAGFSTFVSRITAKTCGPVLVCVRTKAGDVLGGYVSLGPRASRFEGTGRSFKETREPSSLRLARLEKLTKSTRQN